MITPVDSRAMKHCPPILLNFRVVPADRDVESPEQVCDVNFREFGNLVFLVP